MRSPWAIAALVLAWLGLASILAKDPVSIVVLWVIGTGAIVLFGLRRRNVVAESPKPGQDSDSASSHQKAERPAGAQQADVAEASASPGGLRTMTATEIADTLRIGTSEVITAIKTGSLPGNHVGDHWRCNEASLRTWLDGRWHSP